MTIRKQILPSLWYPRGREALLRRLEPYQDASSLAAVAAVAPHAGWDYCLPLAVLSAAALERNAETVVVLGGHLPAGEPPLFAEEDALETGLGPMPIDQELRRDLREAVGGRGDSYLDNTVEVLIPLARYFFPHAQVLWVRLPADLSAYEAGRVLAEKANALGRRLVVLGSTDLTHYGPAYGFSPQGTGEKAHAWVREVNDAAFINAVKRGEASAILKRAREDFSACSAGAVLGALAFAQSRGIDRAELLAYHTSVAASGGIPASFVGYASLAWKP
jgi:AmmeMemoRadiSam system protein B